MASKCGGCGAPGQSPCAKCAKGPGTDKLINDLKKPGKK